MSKQVKVDSTCQAYNTRERTLPHLLPGPPQPSRLDRYLPPLGLVLVLILQLVSAMPPNTGLRTANRMAQKDDDHSYVSKGVAGCRGNRFWRQPRAMARRTCGWDAAVFASALLSQNRRIQSARGEAHRTESYNQTRLGAHAWMLRERSLWGRLTSPGVAFRCRKATFPLVRCGVDHIGQESGEGP